MSRIDILGMVEARLARRFRGSASRLPHPDLPPGTDTLPQIRHIVVLMMENHSFDNYLGTLGRGDGLPTADGEELTAANPDSAGRPVTAHRLTDKSQQPGVPTQSWDGSHEQWADGDNDGFVRSAERQSANADPTVAMGYWTADDLPFYHGLARVFPLADRWFSSCLGPTFPNRRFLVAATANGLTDDRLAHTINAPDNGTVFDLLDAYQISWVNYHPIDHTGPVLKRVVGVHGLRAGRHVSGILGRLVSRGRGIKGDAKSVLQFTADAYPLGLLRYIRHVRSVDRFVADAAAGNLPAVSIVDPDFANNSEENPQDIRHGEAFSARIINAVLQGEGWAHTLLIWVYDEHGGYADHVPPPEAVEPDDHKPKSGGPWSFDRYGFRVPAVIVSPYARPDYVSHVIHDHTSILKLIETKWNLPPLTRRDAQADDLLDSVDLDGPPAFTEPPTLPSPALAAHPEPA